MNQSLTSRLVQAGLCLGLNGSFIKFENNERNQGKSIDFLLREIVTDLTKQEARWKDTFHIVEYLERESNGEVWLHRISLAEWPEWARELREQVHPTLPRPAMFHCYDEPAAQEYMARLHDASERLRKGWRSIWVPFLTGVLEAWADAVELLSTPFQRKAPRIKGPKLHGPTSAEQLDRIAKTLRKAALQMEAGKLKYKSGGVAIFNPTGGLGLEADLRLEAAGLPPPLHDWRCDACGHWSPDRDEVTRCTHCNHPRPDIAQYRKHKS